MRFAIWSLDLAIHDFAFLEYCFSCKNRSLKRVSYLLIFVIRENGNFISAIRDPLFFPFVIHVRGHPLPVRPSLQATDFNVMTFNIQLRNFLAIWVSWKCVRLEQTKLSSLSFSLITVELLLFATKTQSRRFKIFLVWRAFAKSCVLVTD